MASRVFERPKRRAAEKAIGLLFADNSDDEPCIIDSEDEDFITSDFLDGFDQSIIASTVETEPTDDVIASSVSSSDFSWDPMTPLRPPDCECRDFQYDRLNDLLSSLYEASDIFEEVSQINKLIDDVIVPETNLYAQQKGENFCTNNSEVRAFLGISILMGLKTLPELRDYWSSEEAIGVKYISNIMSCKRFEDIRRNLHFCNNAACDNQTRDSKVKNVINHFNRAFQAAMAASKHQSIDERMVKYKGHNILKQYVKGKPVKWGFKFWVRASAKSGFVFETEFYCGKKPDDSLSDTKFGLGESVVLHLCRSITNIGCVVVFDNFFSSPQLMVKLHETGIRAVSTVRKSRKNLPLMRPEKGMTKGEIFGTSSTCGRVFFNQWKDKRVVYTLSNFIGPFQTTTKLRKKKGSAERERVTCPAMVHFYNAYMCGVDISDQMRNYYVIDHKSTYKYYLRVFFDQLDTAICNSFIVFKRLTGSSMSSKQFRVTLAKHLINEFSSKSRSSFEARNKRRKCEDNSASGTSHLPVYSCNRGRCSHCSSKTIDCRSNIKCSACDVSLCLNASRNCFSEFHSFH